MTLKAIRLGVDSCSGACGNIPNVPSSASPDVYTNGIQQVRVTDTYTPHVAFVPHVGRQASGGSGTVFVNGLQLHRNSDAIDCGSTGSNGSGDVFVG